MSGATPRVPLGAATLASQWWLDINLGTHASPIWTPVGGISNFVPSTGPATQDDSDYDAHGFGSAIVTKLAWNAKVTLQRKVTAADPTVYDPGQESLRSAGWQTGVSNVREIRYYEMTGYGTATPGPRAQAYQGYVAVSYDPQGGAMDALDTVAVTLTGRGQMAAITHPDTLPTPAPVITSVAPTSVAVAGGTPVVIYGQYLAGATAVKFDTTAATSFTVLPNGTILAVAAAHAAGAVAVSVTTPAGTGSLANAVTYA